MMQLRYISSIEIRLRCWEQIPTHSQEIEIPRILPSRIVPLFPAFSEHTHITPRESNAAIEHPLYIYIYYSSDGPGWLRKL